MSRGAMKAVKAVKTDHHVSGESDVERRVRHRSTVASNHRARSPTARERANERQVFERRSRSRSRRCGWGCVSVSCVVRFVRCVVVGACHLHSPLPSPLRSLHLFSCCVVSTCAVSSPSTPRTRADRLFRRHAGPQSQHPAAPSSFL